MRSSQPAMSAGAEALKRHCHTLIHTLGPATPPEVFLFRGNAYFGLGRPFFALADYHTAGRVLQLSGGHAEKCQQAVAAFPEIQVGTFPSSDSHTRLFVQPMLSEHCEVKFINEQIGRGVLATAALRAGATVVHAGEPWLRYPIQDGLCSMCAQPLPERLFTCSNPSCHEEYCSRDCRTNALALYHGPVCTNELFQAIELDLYTSMQAARSLGGDRSHSNAAAAQLLMLRVLAAAIHAGTVPSALPELRTLSGRLQYSPRELCNSMLELYERVVRSLQVVTIISYEEMIGVLARVTANCFQREGCVELYLARSMLNHSCDANVCENEDTGEMVALRDVTRGEELTLNYYPHLKHLPFADRMVELERRGLHCACRRCQQMK